jgi:hypothetical protein
MTTCKPVLLLALLTRSHGALPCNGMVGEGGVCCTAGCGQSRVQCAETADVCPAARQGHRGDKTTQANCCPSTIKEAGVECSAEHDAPCVLPAGSQPLAETTTGLAEAYEVLHAAEGLPCASKLEKGSSDWLKDNDGITSCAQW